MAGSKTTKRWSTAVPARQGFYRHVHRVDGAWVERACYVTISREAASEGSSDRRVVTVHEACADDSTRSDARDWGGQWMGPFKTLEDCEKAAEPHKAARARAAKEITRPPPPWRNIREYRARLQEKQMPFWNRFGVTQSAGSRYEASARPLPKQLEMLIAAFDMGLLNDASLGQIRQEVVTAPKPRRNKQVERAAAARNREPAT